MQGKELRVQISEVEHNNKHYKGSIMVAHDKSYVKVVIDHYKPELMGKQVMVKIVKTSTWHVDGEIIEENPVPL
jgi:tRNA A37 methylthiotransferase MiaB